MKKFALFCLLCCFFVASCARQQLYNSAVKVEVQAVDLNVRMSSSGFAVDKDHIIVAAHFCVPMLGEPFLSSKLLSLKVFFVDKNEEIATIDYVTIERISDEYDLCLLSVPNHGLKVVEMNYDATYPIDQKVIAVGAPAGYFPVETDGKVVRNKGFEDSEYEFTTSIPVFSGNSGCPVFDERGRVVGMIVKVYSNYSHLSFAVKADVIKKFLEDNE